MNKNPCIVTPNASIVSGMPTISGGPFPQDVTMNVTSPYGPRDPIYTPNGTTGQFHFGVDFWGQNPPPLVAMTDGVVELAIAGDSMVGNWIRVRNDQYAWEYYHLASPTTLNVGDTVTPGQYVGNVGMTGMATGPHLHLGVQYNGSTVDPMPFFDGGTGVSVTPAFIPPNPVFSKENDRAMVVFTGGTSTDLENLARSVDAGGAWVQDKNGIFKLLVVDGPQFLRDAFDKVFPTPFGAVAVSLVRKDS